MSKQAITKFCITNRYLKCRQILDNVYNNKLYMGKRKNQTQINVAFKPSQKIIKGRHNQKKVISFSTSNILNFPEIRQTRITKIVKTALRKFIQMDREGNKKRLMSALNIPSEQEIVCSAMNIPSIQNLLVSRNQLCSFDHCNEKISQSGVSFIQSMQFFIIENQPQLMLSYVCLVQKVTNKLGILLSPQQNQKLLMGVWNILTKFWSDDFQDYQYSNLSSKIEWGILKLLDFDLNVGKKQRIFMETKIRSLAYLQN